MFPKAAEFLKPVHFWGKLFGVFPVKSVSNGAVSSIYKIFCFFLLATTLKPMYGILIYQYRSHNDIVCLAVSLHAVCNFLCHVLVIIIPIQFREKYIKLFKKLKHVEQLLHSLNIKQYECPQKFRQCAWILLTLSAEITTVLLVYFYSAPMIFIYGIFISYSTLYAFILQLTSLLIVIENKFLLINWHLDYMSNKFPPFLQPPEDKMFIERKVHAKNVGDKFVNPALNKRIVSCCHVKSFNLIHFNLYSCCNLINDYFSLQILAAVLRVSLQIITTSLYVFNSSPTSILRKLICVLHLCYNCSWVFYISNLCYRIKSEVSIYQRLNM